MGWVRIVSVWVIVEKVSGFSLGMDGYNYERGNGDGFNAIKNRKNRF